MRVFLRSPMPGAMIKSIGYRRSEGRCRRRADRHGQEMAEYCDPWVGGFDPFSRVKSAPSTAIAVNSGGRRVRRLPPIRRP